MCVCVCVYMFVVLNNLMNIIVIGLQPIMWHMKLLNFQVCFIINYST